MKAVRNTEGKEREKRKESIGKELEGLVRLNEKVRYMGSEKVLSSGRKREIQVGTAKIGSITGSFFSLAH
eukprot:3048038-Amphidinium_carterae.2